MKKFIVVLLSLVLVFAVVGCSSNKKEEAGNKEDAQKSEQKEDAAKEEKKEEQKEEPKKEAEEVTIKVGASAVPHAQILNVVKDDLKKEGINLEIVEFTDYVIPNTALEDGDLFANFFQHVPYLESFNADHGTHLVSVGPVHVEPLSLYSNKIKNIDELKDGAKIAIPNDPTNEARALILLEDKGLIKLKDKTNLKSTPIDIVENAKNIEFEEADAALLPRVLDDVDGAIINTNYALEANLDPKTAIFTEGAESPYANVLVVRAEDKDSETAKKLLQILQSDKVKEFIEKEYKGSVVPAF